MLLLTALTIIISFTISFGLFLFCLFQYRKNRSSTVSPDIELGLQSSNDHQYKYQEQCRDQEDDQYKDQPSSPSPAEPGSTDQKQDRNKQDKLNAQDYDAIKKSLADSLFVDDTVSVVTRHYIVRVRNIIIVSRGQIFHQH